MHYPLSMMYLFLYCRGKICYLSEQQNYVCITGIQNNTIKRDDVSSLDTTFVKQKSTAWKTIRSFAKVTGSTCFDALGLGGLKKQKEHFEYVFSGKEKTEPSPEVKKYMQHGTVNEINCVATLVSKVLPVFYPTQSYFEEGCKVDYLDNNFMLLVSPDGSLRSSCEFGGKKPCFAVEIKCPYPGNVYKPKVYYELPHYYVPQILSEMSVLETNCIIFLCYSLESTIVFEADFDSMLWDQIMSRLIQCYGKADSKCPTKLPSDLKEFQEKMKQYCKDNVRLIAEVPSVVAKTCGHDVVSSDKNDAKYNQHKSLQQISAESCTVSNLNKTVYEIMETVKEAYGLTRHIATEVVVYLISDLNRSHIPERQHSVPIGYAMKGYSMTTDVMRNMVNDILEKCYHGGLYVPVISFDGQWYTIAVRSANNEPLTILQLMKDVYKQARSIKKSDMLKHMKQINLVPKLSNREEVFELIDNQVEDKITILNGKDVKTTIYTLLKKKETPYLLHTSSTVAALLFNNSTVENKEITEEHENSRTEFLDNLPENIAPLIENDILEQRHIENNSRNDESVENSTQSPENQEKRTIEDEEFIKMLSALQTDSKVKKKKWESISLSEFKTIFQSIEEIRKHFYRVEIQVCMISITDFLKAQHIRFAVSWTKYKLSDLMFNLVNQPEVLMTRSRSMKKLYCLKTLCLMSISKFPKDVLNIVYAEHIYPTEELKWRNNMPFDESTHIEGLNTNIQWYSKPEYVSNRFMHLFSLLDCHHLLTNARIKCCSTGIVEAGIHSNAWSKVARQTSKDGKEIISSALVDDLIDKQRNVYAQKTFSNEVETAMTENGDLEEAIFCKLIREWYQAEDEPGIAALERCERRLNLRTWLLDKIDIGKFPPPGRHVKGIPIVMFEGLMTNIERRIQLFPFIKSGAYNVRALGSLESENFFGQFQDLDPKGSGVLRPDDVSTAISTACELTQARFDPNRVFYMNTSRAKVYPVKELETNSEHLDTRNYVSPHQVNMINTRDHMFDLSERGKRQHPKRKSGEISRPGMPSRGIKPVREHHRCDETKILPHVRMGLSVNEINQ
ncbi:Hypothetical predicted protein [Mytilus galloprovincialis]|uniref:YqaJ viral recombinase domain-containing protein n=1 Tax=Mytilus galloprovincialis TaxID=29158 RepID=A0A8B6D3P8_MYTGA|nr:Hypothetical predicted protein [Mytilus galloprovincialis]